jgi:nucleotide-binding universal stress UspA family protein
MYKRILILTDGSDLSEKAIEHGIALAKVLGAKITALTVLEPFHVSAFEPSMVEQYKKHVAAVATPSRRSKECRQRAWRAAWQLPSEPFPHLASVLI